MKVYVGFKQYFSIFINLEHDHVYQTPFTGENWLFRFEKNELLI